jgi:hypothetical protein
LDCCDLTKVNDPSRSPATYVILREPTSVRVCDTVTQGGPRPCICILGASLCPHLTLTTSMVASPGMLKNGASTPREIGCGQSVWGNWDSNQQPLLLSDVAFILGGMLCDALSGCHLIRPVCHFCQQQLPAGLWEASRGAAWQADQRPQTGSRGSPGWHRGARACSIVYCCAREGSQHDQREQQPRQTRARHVGGIRTLALGELRSGRLQRAGDTRVLSRYIFEQNAAVTAPSLQCWR